MNVKVRLTVASNLTKFNVPKDTIVDIEIEEYLKAVVASEIANSHLEACKAQAIAARTFAMRIMKNRGYLYDNTTDQAYIHSRNNATLYPNAIKAVEDTFGEILQYKGHLILYAAYGASNKGHTVAYKNYPYLTAYPDPWDVAETEKRRAAGEQIRVGNRIGLSQYGARWAANNGKGYREILSFYYPHTDIASNYGEGVNNVNEKRKMNEKEQAIASWALNQVGCGYTWGATGQVLTESVLQSLIARHGSNVRADVVRKWMGKRVYDCASLVSEALRLNTGSKIATGASSAWKGAYWDIKGTIDTTPKDQVVVLYHESPSSNPMSHTGLYVGNDTVVDARGSVSGVLKSAFASYPWTHWALPKGLVSPAEVNALKNKIDGSGGEEIMASGQAKVTGIKLALRLDMSTNNEPLTRLENGTTLDILEKTNATWWRVKSPDGLIGYVMKQYITETGITPVNPQAPDNGESGADEIEDNQHIVNILCKDEAEAKRLLEVLKGAELK